MDKIKISENVMLIRINKLYRELMSPEEMYEATREIWIVGERRYRADYAFTVFNGIVKEVYKINQWFPACTLEYKTRAILEAIKTVDSSKRWEFDGQIADVSIREKYLDKSVRHYLPSFGGANPIKYVNC